MKCLAALLLCLATARGADRQVAITIDDLPRGGDGGPKTLAGVRAMTEQLLQPFREQKIPVTGFVNEGRRMEFGPQELRGTRRVLLDPPLVQDERHGSEGRAGTGGLGGGGV